RFHPSTAITAHLSPPAAHARRRRDLFPRPSRPATSSPQPAGAGDLLPSVTRLRTLPPSCPRPSPLPVAGGISPPASDRFNINSQLEHLQAKYVGTGHADLNRFEWAVNIQRDSYASYIGHYPILAYFALAENESIGRERYNFMQKMLLPCGLPPEREED
ncbi:hypothetical protein Taro_023499, partial [Colocasia esculenta]|nr:hypothetical protein [Colocasia esculenta]